MLKCRQRAPKYVPDRSWYMPSTIATLWEFHFSGLYHQIVYFCSWAPWHVVFFFRFGFVFQTTNSLPMVASRCFIFAAFTNIIMELWKLQIGPRTLVNSPNHATKNKEPPNAWFVSSHAQLEYEWQWLKHLDVFQQHIVDLNIHKQKRNFNNLQRCLDQCATAQHPPPCFVKWTWMFCSFLLFSFLAFSSFLVSLLFSVLLCSALFCSVLSMSSRVSSPPTLPSSS